MASHSWFFSAFRDFTFTLIGLIALAVVSGSYNVMRIVLLTTAVCAMLGVTYGACTTYAAIVRAKLN